jgi:membrane protein implicated in regulation of membrane protease activity
MEMLMEGTAVAWWMWMIFGLALLVFELMTPGGFFVFFFGVAALLIGFLDLIGLHMPLALQGILFAAASVVSILVFRKPLMERFHYKMPKGKVDSMVGETAKAMDTIPSGGYGKAELRGTAWSVQNIGDITIPQAGRCKVEKVEGLTLLVRG